MDKDVSFNEEFADFNIRHVRLDPHEGGPEPGPQVGQTLTGGVQVELAPILDQDLHPVPNLSVLKVSLHQPVVDLHISHLTQGFQNNVGWNDKLLLLIRETDCAISIRKVMESKSLGKKIFSHTSHGDSIRSEKLASIDESSSHESHGVVSLSHDNHSYQSLITIDNEVTTKFSHVLMFPN